MLLVSGTVWTAIAMLWIHGLNLRYPAPFIGMPGRMSGIFSAFYVLSHSFPKPWYKEKTFQQQRKYLFVVFMAEEGIHMAYFGLELAFVHVPSAYQWILALLLIPLQEVLTRGYSWLCDKALGYEDVSSELVASNFVMTFQAMFMSIVLGTSATAESSYILFAVSVLQFLVDTLKVVRYKRKMDVDSLTDDVQALVLSITIEVFVPLCYAVSFSLAYLGPNSTVMGNVSIAQHCTTLFD